ncbi:phosphopantetheine attachment domain protein [Ostertagia ostertagi]
MTHYNFLFTTSHIYSNGFDLDFSCLYTRPLRNVHIPTYSFNRRSIWFTDKPLIFDHYLLGTVKRETEASVVFRNWLDILRHPLLFMSSSVPKGVVIEIAHAALTKENCDSLCITDVRVAPLNIVSPCLLETEVKRINGYRVVSAHVNKRNFFICVASAMDGGQMENVNAELDRLPKTGEAAAETQPLLFPELQSRILVTEDLSYASESRNRNRRNLLNCKADKTLESVLNATQDVLSQQIPINDETLSMGFIDLGLDSLNMVEFVSRLNQKYFPGMDISTADIFDYPTIMQLAEHIRESKAHILVEDHPREKSPICKLDRIEERVLNATQDVLSQQIPFNDETLSMGFIDLGLDSLNMVEFFDSTQSPALDFSRIIANGAIVKFHSEATIQPKSLFSSLLCFAHQTSRDCKENLQVFPSRSTGVIHSAGVVRDGVMERQTSETFSDVFTPKGDGYHAIDTLLRDNGHHLDHFIVMSSFTVITGNVGQLNYGVSNAYLDHQMYLRRMEGKPGTTIHWGNWKEHDHSRPPTGHYSTKGEPLLTDKVRRKISEDYPASNAVTVEKAGPTSAICNVFGLNVFFDDEDDFHIDVAKQHNILQTASDKGEDAQLVVAAALALERQGVPISWPSLYQCEVDDGQRRTSVLEYPLELKKALSNEDKEIVQGHYVNKENIVPGAYQMRDPKEMHQLTAMCQQFYRMMAINGLEYRDQFQVIKSLRRMERHARYSLHDSVVHRRPDVYFVPIAVGEIWMNNAIDLSQAKSVILVTEKVAENDKLIDAHACLLVDDKVIFQYKSKLSMVIKVATDRGNFAEGVNPLATLSHTPNTNQSSDLSNDDNVPEKSSEKTGGVYIVGYDGSFCFDVSDNLQLWQAMKTGILLKDYKFRECPEGSPALMDIDVTEWDPEFFGISPREAKYVDVLQRFMMRSSLADEWPNAGWTIMPTAKPAYSSDPTSPPIRTSRVSTLWPNFLPADRRPALKTNGRMSSGHTVKHNLTSSSAIFARSFKKDALLTDTATVFSTTTNGTSFGRLERSWMMQNHSDTYIFPGVHEGIRGWWWLPRQWLRSSVHEDRQTTPFANGLMTSLAEKSESPTMVIHWGPWKNTGMLQGDHADNVFKQLHANGWEALEPVEALDVLNTSAKDVVVFRGDFELIAKQQEHLRKFLTNMLWLSPEKEEITTERLLEEIIARISGSDRISEERHTPLMNLGLDSLMIEEIRVAINERFGCALKATEIYDNCTLSKLESLVASRAKLQPERSITPSEPEALPRSSQNGDIAIIGYSGSFSGCRNVEEFWENLLAGKECITRAESPEEGFVDAAGLIDDIDKFDHNFWKMTSDDASMLDPQLTRFLTARLQLSGEIRYVECHGTGTLVGDEIEIESMKSVYGQRKDLTIGSVKANIGHGFAASGMAGLFKVIKILQDQIIPPQINLDCLQEDIPFQINRKPIALDSGSLAACRALADYLRSRSDIDLEAVAATLQQNRDIFKYRAAFVVKSVPEAISQLEAFNSPTTAVPLDNSNLCFFFAPQGVQYPNMEKASMDYAEVFKRELERLTGLASKLFQEDFMEIMYPQINQDSNLILAAKYAQVALFIISRAIVAQLDSWGISSDFLIGHSVGEYAAACYAGIMDELSCMKLLKERGELVSTTKEARCSPARFGHEALPADVEVTAHLSDNMKCVVGPPGSIEALKERLLEKGIAFRELSTEHRIHSSMMMCSRKISSEP